MSAAQVTDIKKIGIIAGAGTLPSALARACEAQGIEPFIIAFRGSTDPEAVNGRGHMWARAGGAGRVIRTLRGRGVHDIVMIGGMYRPKLWEIVPDFTTLSFFLFHGGVFSGGDNDFLTRLRMFLERKGLRIHGIHTFMPDLLMPKGALGTIAPTTEHAQDITFGIEHSQAIGARDIGQSVVVCGGAIVGEEDKAGTSALMVRCAEYKGAILVKTCKPHQDRDIDMPTIGPDTVRVAAQAGFAGIAVQAGAALIVERETVIKMADEHGIFVIGVEV